MTCSAGTITLRQNNPYSRTLTFSAGGVAVDITDYTIYCSLKKTLVGFTDTNAIATCTLVIDPDQVTNTGKATFSFTAAQLQVAPGNYYLDFRVFDDDAELVGNTTLIDVVVLPIGTHTNLPPPTP